MRDYGDEFFGAGVQVAETGLAAGEHGTAGEGVRGGRGFGRVGWVDGAEVDGGEERFERGDWTACVAGLVGVF